MKSIYFVRQLDPEFSHLLLRLEAQNNPFENLFVILGSCSELPDCPLSSFYEMWLELGSKELSGSIFNGLDFLIFKIHFYSKCRLDFWKTCHWAFNILFGSLFDIFWIYLTIKIQNWRIILVKHALISQIVLNRINRTISRMFLYMSWELYKHPTWTLKDSFQVRNTYSRRKKSKKFFF